MQSQEPHSAASELKDMLACCLVHGQQMQAALGEAVALAQSLKVCRASLEGTELAQDPRLVFVIDNGQKSSMAFDDAHSMALSGSGIVFDICCAALLFRKDGGAPVRVTFNGRLGRPDRALLGELLEKAPARVGTECLPMILHDMGFHAATRLHKSICGIRKLLHAADPVLDLIKTDRSADPATSTIGAGYYFDAGDLPYRLLRWATTEDHLRLASGSHR